MMIANERWTGMPTVQVSWNVMEKMQGSAIWMHFARVEALQMRILKEMRRLTVNMLKQMGSE